MVKCVVQHTPQFSELWRYGRGMRFAQQDLLRILRVELNGCLEDEAKILPKLQKLDFKVTQELIFSIPVHLLPGALEDRYNIRVILEIDFEKESFILGVLPNQIQIAKFQAMEKLLEPLRGLENVKLFAGRPQFHLRDGFNFATDVEKGE
jgi:hypothetical protein